MAKFKVRGRVKPADSGTKKIMAWITEGADHCEPDHNRVEENNNYIAGEQWAKGDLERQKMRERPSMPLNKIMPALNAIANREIMNRYVPKAYPRSDTDAGWADVANAYVNWQRDMAEAEHEETMAFRANVASGYGVVHYFWDNMANEGEGLTCQEEVPLWQMIWDPSARKQNLVDRRWHACGKWVPISEAEQKWGISKDKREFFTRITDETGRHINSASTQVGTRWAWGGITAGRWVNRSEREMFIVEAEWRAVKTQYKIAVPVQMEEFAALFDDPAAQMEMGVDEQTQQPIYLTGEQWMQMTPEDQQMIAQQVMMNTEVQVIEKKEDLVELVDRHLVVFGEQPVYASYDKWNIEYAIVASDGNKGGEVTLESGERPMGYTYEFMTGFPWETKDGIRFIGFVDLAKGLQDWRNSFMSLALTRMATSPKTHLVIEEGAVDDQDEFLDQMANPRGVTWVPNGFISGWRFIKMDAPSFPPMERELIALADQGVNEMAGLSGVELGQQGDLRRVSGTVVQSVKEASNTILALMFDSLRRFRKRTGKLVLSFMHHFYDPESLIRIVGEENAEFIRAQETWPDASRFDIKFDEGKASVSEKMETFDFMTRTGTWQMMMDRQMMPDDVMIDMIPTFSESDKSKVKKHLAQRRQQEDRLNQLVQFLSQDPNAKALTDQFFQQEQQGGQ